MDSFYSIFILLGSGSLLFVMLISISLSSHIHPPSPSPPLFSKPSSSLSGCMNTAEFHLNPRTWELWAKARGAADTPLPHPEQLLNLRNRIISAKGRSHCSTVRNAVNKPQKKKQKKEWKKGEASRRRAAENCLSA